MTRDQEPVELASISVTKDDMGYYAAKPGVKKPATQTHGAAAQDSGARHSTPIVLWLCLLLALAGLAYLFYQNQTLMQEGHITAQALQKLQSQLSDTGEQANLSVDALRIQLNEQGSEIQKLWDLTNKRLKVDIARNKELIDDQGKILTQHSAGLESQDKSNKSLQQQNKDLENKLSQQAEQLLAQNKALQADVADMNKRLKAVPEAAQKQLDEQSASIKAIDATRIQHNRRLSQIDKQLENLKAELQGLKQANQTPTSAAP
jgi:chromosome segregation ATPase